jgi:hypothetical protein
MLVIYLCLREHFPNARSSTEARVNKGNSVDVFEPRFEIPTAPFLVIRLDARAQVFDKA